MTLECAGNGRALLSPRAASQPWLREAVGTAEWTGTPLAPVLREAGLAEDALEVVFTGLDRGVQGDVEHLYERSLPIADALRDEVLLAYAVNGQPLPPQHGFPLRVVVPGWYGMSHGEPVSEFAWRGWSYAWEAEPGEHELCCRAGDAAGNVQPLSAEWNFDGFCNNAVQRVHVLVS